MVRFLHIDTLNNPKLFNQSPQNNTFQFIPGSQAYSPHDYNVIIKIPTPVVGVQKIYIKSFQTAILFPNVRASSLLNYIIINVPSSTPRKILLNDAIYTNVSNLLTDLTTAASVLYPSDNWAFALDPVSGNVRVSSNVINSFTVQDTNLSYMLGFRSGINLNFNGYVISAYLYNLAIDTYLNLYISNIQSSFNPNTNNIRSSFKIPINSGSYQINYTSQNLNFEEYIYNENPNQPITEFDIIIYDVFGYALHSHGASLAMTLALAGVNE